MREMIPLFQEMAGHLESQLMQIAERLRQGRIPEQEVMEQVIQATDELQALYHRIAEQALDCSPKEEKADYSVEELVCLWEKREDCLQRQQIRKTLERFLLVYAEDKGFAQALAPFHERAASLLVEAVVSTRD